MEGNTREQGKGYKGIKEEDTREQGTMEQGKGYKGTRERVQGTREGESKETRDHREGDGLTMSQE